MRRLSLIDTINIVLALWFALGFGMLQIWPEEKVISWAIVGSSVVGLMIIGYIHVVQSEGLRRKLAALGKPVAMPAVLVAVFFFGMQFRSIIQEPVHITFQASTVTPTPTPTLAPSQFWGGPTSRWAVNSAENCNVSSRSYVLNVSDKTITWIDGDGNADIEVIDGFDYKSFTTETSYSRHLTGAGTDVGTNWQYLKDSNSIIEVLKDGTPVFQLTECSS